MNKESGPEFNPRTFSMFDVTFSKVRQADDTQVGTEWHIGVGVSYLSWDEGACDALPLHRFGRWSIQAPSHHLHLRRRGTTSYADISRCLATSTARY
jgi:hypothetical protein